MDVDPVNREALDNTNAPTASHALATTDHEEKGAVQLDGPAFAGSNGTELSHSRNITDDTAGGLANGEAPIADLGWHESPEAIPDPLVGGVSNEDLWTLIRRFDKASEECIDI